MIDRDYYAAKERNVKERMCKGGSAEEGLRCRMTASQRPMKARTFLKNGKKDEMENMNRMMKSYDY